MYHRNIVIRRLHALTVVAIVGSVLNGCGEYKSNNFGSYSEAKIDKLIELQRLRGGIFESLTVCRFPYAELDFELEWYTKYLRAATGTDLSWNTLIFAADKTLNLIRAFWIREYGSNWTRAMDIPPVRWFKEPLTKGPLKGSKLDSTKYDVMLQKYYNRRGWNARGIPKRITLRRLGLPDVARQLSKYVGLSD